MAKLTRRMYLILKVLEKDDQVGWGLASEAVASVAIEHPEWDMDEEKTWEEWEEVE